MEQFKEVKLGDIVILRTARFEQIANKSITTIPPTMVVIEIIREYFNNKHPYDPQTGKIIDNIPNRLKVNCLWYSQRLGKFITKWIYLDLLDIIDIDEAYDNCKIGQIVSLKTICSLEQFAKKLEVNITDNEGLKENKRNYLQKLLTFLPPKMIVKKVERVPIKLLKPTHDKNTGELKRNSTKVRVKCIWHDESTGKYSEDWFALEALVFAENRSSLISSLEKDWFENIVEDMIVSR